MSVSENLGLGVMLAVLGGSKETAGGVAYAIGRRLVSVEMAKTADDPDFLALRFEDGSRVELWDAGQSCCEARYMSTDDDLASFAGATVVSIEERGAPSIKADDNRDDHHDVAFLVVTTDRGAITVATHNEHNGYYGGFALAARIGVA